MRRRTFLQLLGVSTVAVGGYRDERVLVDFEVYFNGTLMEDPDAIYHFFHAERFGTKDVESLRNSQGEPLVGEVQGRESVRLQAVLNHEDEEVVLVSMGLYHAVYTQLQGRINSTPMVATAAVDRCYVS